jgi:hypothetical protein
MPRRDALARREYNRAYQRRWYRLNRALHIARVNRSRSKRSARTRRLVDRLKARPCADCGVRYPPYVMDFDHVSGTKLKEIAAMTSRWAWHRIVAEIAKCEVVCANCHRERTHRRRLGRPLRAGFDSLGSDWIGVLVPA